MSTHATQTPAARLMDEAIDLALEGRSPYPDRAAFVDADTSDTKADVEHALEEGRAVVLVSADGSTRVLRQHAPG